MSEVIEGIWHWSAPHPRIGQQVHSYLLSDSHTAIDPIGAPGIEAELADRGGVERVVLTNRHHLRDAEALRERFGCEILAPASGMGEFDSGEPVSPYEWGEELAAGVVAHAVAAICPDDGALHIRTGAGALALADSVIGWEGRLSFVPDFLMDRPEQVKAETVAAFERLLELDFDALLLAHGEPIASGGKRALESFCAEPAQADFGA